MYVHPDDRCGWLPTAGPFEGVRHTSQCAALTYILAFGLTKAATNYFAGSWSDGYGSQPALLAGWLLAIPVPLALPVVRSQVALTIERSRLTGDDVRLPRSSYLE